MKSVFVAFAFRDEDRPLVSIIDHLAASYYIKVITGEDLGGEELTPAVKARIGIAQGLVALLTRRDEKVRGGWTTHQWVQDELSYGRSQGLQAIALIEEGVDVGGMYASNEYIRLDRNNPLKAFLSLASSLGTWKREAGRVVKARIMPPSLATKVKHGNGCKGRWRFMVEGKFGEWREAPIVKEPGAAFAYLNGVQDEHMIELELEVDHNKWRSEAVSQWMQVQLKEEKRP